MTIIQALLALAVGLYALLRFRGKQLQQAEAARLIADQGKERAKLDVQLEQSAENVKEKENVYEAFVKEFDRANPGLLNDLSRAPGDKADE